MARGTVIIAGIIGLLSLTFIAGRLTGRGSHEVSSSGRTVLYYVDPMHPAYRSSKPGIAPDCGMALVPVYDENSTGSSAAQVSGAEVVLTPERQQLIGVRVAVASRTNGTRMVRTTGRVVPDETRFYRIQAGIDGWVESLNNNPPGTRVKKGEVLATLYSPDIRTAQINYLGFVAGVQRLKANGGTDMRNIEESGRINEEQLRLLGMGDEQLKQLAETSHATSSLDLASPGDGVVLGRSISPQQRFERGAELYRIADLTKVWIVADIHGDDGALSPGTRVMVNVPEVGKKIQATVSSATPLFDEVSRTLKLRLEADNPGYLLRPDMFVDVEFQSRAAEGLSIPADAVLDSGTRKIVYVETADGVFAPRQVQIAGTFGDRVTIAAGINEGERIVVSGNFLLDSESRMRSAAQPDAPASVNAAATAPARLTRAALTIAESDPVCGMALKAGETVIQQKYAGKTYSFCSESCLKDFRADPARYAGKKTQGSTMPRDQADHHD